MQFNDITNGTGACQEIDDICNSDSNSYPIKSKTRRVNQALDRFYTLAFEADGRWPYDDKNYGTVPIQTIALVTNTQSYDIGTFTSEVLDVLRVEMLDAAGNALQLSRLKRENVTGALTAYQATAGTPREYDLVGQYIYLYPKPNYNSATGLKFYIQRNKSPFVYGDTTKVLPVPSLFEAYICRLAALPYLVEYQKAQKNDISKLIASDEEKIASYFVMREESVARGMRPSGDNNK